MVSELFQCIQFFWGWQSLQKKLSSFMKKFASYSQKFAITLKKWDNFFDELKKLHSTRRLVFKNGGEFNWIFNISVRTCMNYAQDILTQCLSMYYAASTSEKNARADSAVQELKSIDENFHHEIVLNLFKQNVEVSLNQMLQ